MPEERKLPRMDDLRNYRDDRAFKSKKKKTSNETWKAFERRVSKDFNTTRTPLSGMVKTITNSDTLHKKIYVECKLRSSDKEFTFWEDFERWWDNAPEGKVSMLEIHPNNREKVWLFEASDFLKLMYSEPFDLNLISCVIKSKVYRSVVSLYDETIERSAIEDKIPVIAIKKKGKKSYLIGTSPDELVKLQKQFKIDKHGRE